MSVNSLLGAICYVGAPARSELSRSSSWRWAGRGPGSCKRGTGFWLDSDDRSPAQIGGEARNNVGLHRDLPVALPCAPLGGSAFTLIVITVDLVRFHGGLAERAG